MRGRRDIVKNGLGLRLVGAFTVGFVGLTLEIAYTRVISFKFFYYYTYFVIGLALLGLGASAVVVALSSRLRSADSLHLMRGLLPLSGAIGLVSYVVVARLDTDANLIWNGSGSEAIREVALLLVLSLSLTAVFFALGLVLSALVVAEAHEVRRLYFWDLTGAALACLFAVPLQALIGPPAMILGSSVAVAAVGLAVALATSTKRSLSYVAPLVVVVGAVLASTFDIRPDAAKNLTDSDDVVASDWGPVFRVDVLDLGDLKILNHDALWGSTIWRFDGTPATTARFDSDNRQLPFAALGDEPDRILIIGAAGGNEIQAALTFGVGHVDAVELNPVTVDLLHNQFNEFSGGIVDDPRVNYVQGDGRTFLARSDQTYDMIWFVAPDSYAANNAATSGAFVLSESYLYTTEMIQESFDHLSPRGAVVAQFGDFEFDTRPTRTARYLVTARNAFDGLDGTFADHTMLLVDESDLALARISTIMLFRSRVELAAADRVNDALGNLPNTRPIHLPGITTTAGVTADLITGDDTSVAAIVNDYPYDISVVTDDQPFFWHFTSFSDVLTNWSRDYENFEIAIGERLLVALFAIAAIVAGALLWAPFAISRRRDRGDRRTQAPRGRGALFAYFAAIGLGFMLVEISMIQRFALLLGYPTLSLSVSLFTLLIATAVGARLSGFVGGGRTRRMLAAAVALTAITVVYLVISNPVTDAALAWSSSARIAIVIALLFPVGLLLGVFLPAGIDAATRTADSSPGADEGRLVAWCWAVNGFFAVLGSSLTTMSSMSFGFNRTLLAGVVLYWLATTAYSRMPSMGAATTGVELL
jgi:hypothetical protein